MRTYTHIIFKNTSNLDFIIPYYSLKFKSGKFDTSFLEKFNYNQDKNEEN